MDISDTLAPTSDQLDAVDLLTGPRTFTIAKVSKGNAEQPVNIHLTEFPRPWRPGKSMRRVLVACWGADAAQYVGRRVTLWCDPTVRFGGQEVGGVRVTHLSHIEKAKKVPLLITRGKSATYVVEPLKDAPTESRGQQAARRLAEKGTVTEADVATCEDRDQLRAWWNGLPDLRPAIEARVEALKAADGVVPSRFLDADGAVVEKIGGVWVHPEDGSRGEPVTLQQIRESAWVTVCDGGIR